MLEKDQLRKLVNQIISKKTPEEIAEESAQIRKNLDRLYKSIKKSILPFKYSPHFMAYYPLNDEVDIKDSLEKWSATGLSLPRMVDNEIVPFFVRDLEKDLCVSKNWGLKQGGIKEPSDACQSIESFELKLIRAVIIPGRAFDKRGNRVGRGKGHYDKFLLNIPRATKIGVCFHNQLFGSVPREDHDIQLDHVVTNKGIYNCAEWRNKEELL